MMKIAGPAPGGSGQVAAPAPPPNPVGGPTVAPAGGGGGGQAMFGRRGAVRINASAPTGMGGAHSADPLQAQAPAGPPGQPVSYNGMMLPQEEVQALQQQEAEAQALAQKNAPKPQAAQKQDTPFNDQLLASFSSRLDKMSAHRKAAFGLGSSPGFTPVKTFPGGGTSVYDDSTPSGLASPGQEGAYSHGMFTPGSGPDKFYGGALKFLTKSLTPKAKTWVDREIQHPSNEYGFALARNIADPVATGGVTNPWLSLAANYGLSQMGQPEMDPAQIARYGDQAQGALGLLQ